MVKADLAQDYYGDLGVPVGASEAEIKKAFKKLGMVSLFRNYIWIVLIILLRQPSSTIPIGTLDERLKPTRNFRQSTLRMRFLQTLNSDQNMIQAGESAVVGRRRQQIDLQPADIKRGILGRLQEHSGRHLQRENRNLVPVNHLHHLLVRHDMPRISRLLIPLPVPNLQTRMQTKEIGKLGII